MNRSISQAIFTITRFEASAIMPGTKRFDEDTGLRVINFQSCRGGGGVWLDDKLLPDPITTRLVCRARIIRERSQARLITKKKRNGNNRENEGPSKNNVRSFRSIRRRITLHRFQFFSSPFLEFFHVKKFMKKGPFGLKITKFSLVSLLPSFVTTLMASLSRCAWAPVAGDSG